MFKSLLIFTLTTDTALAGALCNDGTNSKSTGSGTCSHHGGVNIWTPQPSPTLPVPSLPLPPLSSPISNQVVYMYHSPQPTYDDEPVSSMLLVRHIQVLIDLGVEVTPESLYKLDFLLAKGVIPTKLMFGPSPPTMTFEEVERHNLLIRILINLGVEVTAESLYKLDLLLTNGIVPTKLMFN